MRDVRRYLEERLERYGRARMKSQTKVNRKLQPRTLCIGLAATDKQQSAIIPCVAWIFKFYENASGPLELRP